MISLNLFERIRQLAREGYGYEDIAAKLNLPWREVRPIVIGGQNVDQRTSIGSGEPANREIQTAPDRI